MNHINSIILALSFTLVSATLADQIHPTPQQSPLTESFLLWQQDNQLLSRSQGTRASGLIPSPIDNFELLMKYPVENRRRASLPITFDLRSSGLVTAVKNQGETGNCWAFTTIAAIEGAAILAGMGTLDLSEKNLRNRTGFDRTATVGNLQEDGGNIEKSLAYLTRGDGPVLESLDPFDDTDPTSEPFSAHLRIGESRTFTGKEAIKQAIIERGPLYSNMYSSDSYYRYGTRTTYYLPNIYTTNHAVTIIGWDDTISVPTAPEKGAWLVKNSWGATWGDAGYFWLSYSDQSAVTSANSFGKLTQPSPKESIYYYDTLGATGTLGYQNSLAVGAVSFTMRRNELLRSVGTFVRGNNANLTISICKTRKVDTFYSNMYLFEDTISTQSVQLQETGYYAIDLPAPIQTATNDPIHVIVKYSIPGSIYPIPTERAILGYSSAARTNPLESFISSDGSVFTDMHTNLKQSVAIKLITEEYDPTGIVPTGKNDLRSRVSIKENRLIISATQGSRAAVSLYSMRGQKIWGKENIHCEETTQIDLPIAAAGIYVAKTIVEGQQFSQIHVIR